jgi:uncharacterized protein YcfJ
MKTTIRLLSFLLIIAFLSGCATPRGRYYGTTGGLLGAVIGGAAGGPEGAIIGGAAGAGAGGLLGDQQTYEMQREAHEQWQYDQEDYYRSNPPSRYDRYCNDCNRAPYSGYVEPCRKVYMPVYDRYGYIVGRRLECQ